MSGCTDAVRHLSRDETDRGPSGIHAWLPREAATHVRRSARQYGTSRNHTNLRRQGRGRNDLACNLLRTFPTNVFLAQVTWDSIWMPNRVFPPKR